LRKGSFEPRRIKRSLELTIKASATVMGHSYYVMKA